MELEPLDAARERRAADTKVAPVARAVRAGVVAGGSARAVQLENRRREPRSAGRPRAARVSK